MTDCAFIEKLLYPYLDGELDARQNLEVEAHLLVCQKCCDLLDEEKRFLSLIKNGCLGQEGPPALKAKIERMLHKKREPLFHLFLNHPFKMAFTAALTAILLFLFFTGTPLEPERNGIPPFIRASVESHLRLMNGNLPLEIESHDPRAVAAWFKKRIDFMPELPALKDDSIVLLGGRLSQFKGENMALISYRIEDSPVTLFIVRGNPASDVQSSDFTYLQGRRFNFSHQHGLNTIAWSDDGNNFALTSVFAPLEIVSCKVCHAKGSGLADLKSLLGI
jgi:anti-sigma factor (TIGR02949 family)